MLKRPKTTQITGYGQLTMHIELPAGNTMELNLVDLEVLTLEHIADHLPDFQGFAKSKNFRNW